MHADAVGVELRVLRDLAEMHHGEMAGMTAGEADAAFPGLLAARESDKYRWRFPRGESYEDVDGRAARAVGEVRHSKCRRALIVSHEMIGRMLLRQVTQRAPQETLGLRQPHHQVYRVDPTVGSFVELSTS